MGIEPTSKAWEAFILPLNYTRALQHSYEVHHNTVLIFLTRDLPEKKAFAN